MSLHRPSLGHQPISNRRNIVENTQSTWQTAAILIARLIFASVFLMAVSFKFMDMGATAGYIAAAGFPLPLFLAWCAAALEALLVIAFLSGAFFTPAAIIAAIYVIFLGFSFHGPSHWAGNQAEFGFFVDHFTFVAGLLFAAVHGPGSVLVAPVGRPARKAE
ncbi:DoxX family protein [Rhizobium tropici]|uniref:DoxX family protein n=1 Tax=Rhizobium tropici TaxID=398 RepID=A0A329YCI9_RHITR|nr:DoxX family protein [Rhizobium tropici]